MTAAMTHPQSTVAPLARDSARLAGFDLMRVIAALAVVWIHASETPQTNLFTHPAWFAVPFFAMSVTYFAACSAELHRGKSLPAYACSRLWRLYVPMLAWSAIYLLVLNAKYLAGLRPTPAWPHWPLLWRGATVHMWFIPFAVVMSFASFAAGRLLLSNRIQTRRWVGMLLLGLGALAAAARLPEALMQEETLGSSWQVLPAAIWGVACWAICPPASLAPPVLAAPGRSAMQSKVMISACGLCLFLPATAGLLLEWDWLLINLAGAGAFLAGFVRIGGRACRILAVLGGLTLGVYLCHGVALGIWGTLLRSILHRGDLASTDVIVFVLASVTSFAVVYQLRTWRYTAWLFP